jgi:hypothetical protein
VSKDLPAAAAWRHVDARVGFEVVFLHREAGGYRLDGHSVAVEGGVAWSVRYELVLDAGWATRDAYVVGRSVQGDHEVRLEGDGAGGWRVDGKPAQQLTGCLDVDLEASACTNALPVHRLGLEVGQRADAPAAYVRALDLRVGRLEQQYARLPNDSERSRYDYTAPEFDFKDVLVYDEYGLVLQYPGIAIRAA